MRGGGRGHVHWGSTIIVACALATGLVAAQAGSTAPPATAMLSGTVVSGEAGAPVRVAVVTVAGTGLVARRSTITDDSGRFTFANLPAGRFTVSATKAAYVGSVSGARTVGRPGTPIALAAGQHVRDVRITLTRGGVVSGTVRDPNGDPAMGIEVFAITAAVAGLDGELTVIPSTVLTDDRGMYRIFGLAPGEYLIGATIRIQGSGDIGVMAPQEIDAALRALQASATGAGVSPPGARSGATPTAQRGLLFAPTFYPGTAQLASAARTAITGGDEHAGLNFSLTMVPTVHIEGTVSTADGSALPRFTISLDPEGPQIGSSSGLGPRGTPSPDGTFRFQSVTPGTYTLTARVQPPASPRGRGAGATEPIPRAWARTKVVVQGSPITGIALTLRPPLRVTGRFVFDGTSPPPAMEGFVVSIGPNWPMILPDGVSGMMAAGGSSAAAADGTFKVTDVLPGRYAFRIGRTVRAPLTGWTLRSVVANGRDLLDTGVEIGDTDLADVVVTYTDKPTELTGVLQTAAGLAAADYHVVVFTTDKTLWRPSARRITSARPDSEGRFLVRGLPPGDYHIGAVVDFAQEDLGDPTWLAALVPASVKLTLSDGERKTQDLRIAR